LLCLAAVSLLVAWPLLRGPLASPSRFVRLVGRGSGTYIRNNLILSCAHGKNIDNKVTIRMTNGMSRPGRVVWFSPSNDLSLVQTSRNPFVLPVTIADGSFPSQGTRVRLLGFGKGNELRNHEGVVIGTSRLPPVWGDGTVNLNLGKVVELSAFAEKGDSGGAVLFDGQLVGVMVAISEEKNDDGLTAHTCICVPVETIRKVLAEWDEHEARASGT